MVMITSTTTNSFIEKPAKLFSLFERITVTTDDYGAGSKRELLAESHVAAGLKMSSVVLPPTGPFTIDVPVPLEVQGSTVPLISHRITTAFFPFQTPPFAVESVL